MCKCMADVLLLPAHDGNIEFLNLLSHSLWLVGWLARFLSRSSASGRAHKRISQENDATKIAIKEKFVDNRRVIHRIANEVVVWR